MKLNQHGVLPRNAEHLTRLQENVWRWFLSAAQIKLLLFICVCGIDSGRMKKQPTSVRSPLGTCVLSESPKLRIIPELWAPLSFSLSVSVSLLLLSYSLFSLPPLLYHFSIGVRTRPSIGKLHPSPLFSSSSSSSSSFIKARKQASLVIGVNTSKLKAAQTDSFLQKMVVGGLLSEFTIFFSAPVSVTSHHY